MKKTKGKEEPSTRKEDGKNFLKEHNKFVQRLK